MTAFELIHRKRRHGLTDNQALVMLALGDRLLRLIDIAETCRLNPSSVARVLDSLRTANLIESDRPATKFGKCEPAFYWLRAEGVQTVAKLLGKLP